MERFEVDRHGERRQLSLLVEGRVRARQVYVDLVDVSEGGCRIRGKFGFVTKGETVSLKISGFKAPLGKVVWVKDEEAGVSFEGNLHTAVLDHICNKQPAR